MNLEWLDWTIIGAFMAVLVSIALVSHRYTKSVADFLVTGRCAGRYVLCMARGMALMGAIHIIGTWQLSYEAGFTASWWHKMTAPIGVIMIVTGFAVYRYRQTRSMTVAQYIELRYSKKLRIFMGLVCFATGLFCFGIMPSVAASFIIYFIGLPTMIPTIFGDVSTYPVLMAGMILVAFFFTAVGGQTEHTAASELHNLSHAADLSHHGRSVMRALRGVAATPQNFTRIFIQRRHRAPFTAGRND